VCVWVVGGVVVAAGRAGGVGQGGGGGADTARILTAGFALLYIWGQHVSPSPHLFILSPPITTIEYFHYLRIACPRESAIYAIFILISAPRHSRDMPLLPLFDEFLLRPILLLI